MRGYDCIHRVKTIFLFTRARERTWERKALNGTFRVDLAQNLVMCNCVQFWNAHTCIPMRSTTRLAHHMPNVYNVHGNQISFDKKKKIIRKYQRYMYRVSLVCLCNFLFNSHFPLLTHSLIHTFVRSLCSFWSLGSNCTNVCRLLKRTNKTTREEIE